jgi:hypothetical protein
MVANTELLLTSAQRQLRWTWNDRNWTTVVLSSEQGDRTLGAEDLKYLRRNLGSFLRKPTPDLSWVLTLSETHGSVYGAAVEQGVVLRFQDRNAKFFDEVRLDDAERKLWLAQIDSVPDGAQEPL